MRLFIKYVGISLGIQAVVITNFLMIAGNYGGNIMKFLALPGPVSDIAYVVYGIPSIFLFTLLKLPDSTRDANMPLAFVLWLIPAVFYSLLIGLAALIIGSLWRRRVSKSELGP